MFYRTPQVFPIIILISLVLGKTKVQNTQYNYLLYFTTFLALAGIILIFSASTNTKIAINIP